jgi:hypothetical protein
MRTSAVTGKRAMRHLPRILPIVLLVLALPAAAIGKPRRTVAPPGVSGISQYVEVVPSAAGPTPPRGGAGASGPGSPLTASQSRYLNGLGPDGRTLAAVVDATAPQTLGVPVQGRSVTPARPAGGTGAGPSGVAQPHGNLPATANLPLDPTSSPVSMILGAAGGGGGPGVLLPGFLLVSALAAGALAVRRRRTAS